jgi:[ribosomal protein S5]-alanine N-acetyltransferase
MPGRAVPELVTPRLLLRGFREDDAADFHAAYGDSGAMRHWIHGPCPDLARTLRYIQGWMRPVPRAWTVWAVARRSDDRCIGLVDYHSRSPANRRAEIAYILAPAAHGQGLAAEAVGRLVTYLQQELGVHRIEAQIAPENAASRALAERLGFVLEAPLLRDRWRVGNEYRSAALYALVAS